MTSNYIVTVLGPNGRRTSVKVKLSTSVMQIIEEACQKQNLDSQFYNIKHQNRILDSSSTVYFSNVPNNCCLELIETLIPRTESKVTVNLATDSGERHIADFNPSCSLQDILNFHKTTNDLLVPSHEAEVEPVIVYTMRRVKGEELRSTTLKSLGILKGNCTLRYSVQEKSLGVSFQANVSQPLAKLRKKDMAIKEEYHRNENEYFSNTVEERMEVDNAVVNCSSQAMPCPPLMKAELDAEGMREDKLTTPVGIKSKESGSIHGHFDSKCSHDKNEKSSTLIKIGDHDAILFSLNEATPTVSMEESDAFFQHDLDDIKKLHLQQLNQLNEFSNKPLMTYQMRQMENDVKLLAAMNRHPITQLRICFPERNVIQASFKPQNTIQEVMDFIRPFLVRNDISFYLYTDFPKLILNPQSTLVEANCIPKARIYFGCDEQLASYINEATLSKKSSFEAACKEVVGAGYQERIRPSAHDLVVKGDYSGIEALGWEPTLSYFPKHGLGGGRPARRRPRSVLRAGVAVWNIRGVNVESKRLQVCDIFREGRLDMLGLCETNLKGMEEFEWNGVKGVRSGMAGNGRAKEGMGLLVSDSWYDRMTTD